MQTPYSTSSTLYYFSVSTMMKTSTPDVGKKHYFEVTQLRKMLERGPATARPIPFMYLAALDQCPELAFKTKVSVPQLLRQSWCSYSIRTSLNFLNFHLIPSCIRPDIHMYVQAIKFFAGNTKTGDKKTNNDNNNHYWLNGSLSFG